MRAPGAGCPRGRSRSGGHAHLDDVEPVEQVLAEAPGARRRPPGRGWSPRPRARPRAASRFSPTRSNSLVLQEAQQLGLQRRRDLADLVEEERAALGGLDAPGLVADRAGEGAARVAEQLAREQLLGQRRAVHGDEGPRRRAGSRVQRARAGRPCRCRSRRAAAPARPTRPRARSVSRAARIAGESVREVDLGHASAEPLPRARRRGVAAARALARSARRRADLRGRERLGQVVEGAARAWPRPRCRRWRRR